MSELSKVTSETIEWNEKFLQESAKEAFTKVIEMINDAIDWTIFLVKGEPWREYPRFALANYILHVFMPLSYGILMDAFVGNLPACFMELRVMLEALVKSYYADLRYPDRGFFQEKIKLLEEELDHKGVSSSKLMKEFDKEAIALWGKLSEKWIHAPGLIDRIVEAVVDRGTVPGYALVIPILYDKGDLKDLEELCEYISTFRMLAKKALEDWKARQPIQ